jgi:hypothetical protein
MGNDEVIAGYECFEEGHLGVNALGHEEAVFFDEHKAAVVFEAFGEDPGGGECDATKGFDGVYPDLCEGKGHWGLGIRHRVMGIGGLCPEKIGMKRISNKEHRISNTEVKCRKCKYRTRRKCREWGLDYGNWVVPSVFGGN